MTGKIEIYKCEKCGNIVEVFATGAGTLVCCGENMVLQEENTVDAAKEKHVPVIEKSGGKVTVRVGQAAHPMEEKHYIQWIELVAGDDVYTRFLSPGDAPEAVFTTDSEAVYARAYCNLHGHWKS